MKKKIIGTSTRPRLYIFKSNKHIYAQLIDDLNNKILASSSTISKDIKKFANCETAKIVGKKIANEIKAKGLNQIVFDRGDNIYHGQIKALADSTRKEGINF
uniref:Large ribosomal subunit protein uL18c n=1 Tax=Sphondylothamnion multifidum TaxID=193186 RepID=A0A4D6WYF5_9FLOR|nr:ribosomal protein L18 [Sphondylothamnion multifidum]